MKIAVRALFLCMALVSASASAEQIDFARIHQQVRIGDGDLDTAWSVEVNKEISESRKTGTTPGTGGGGGDGGGQKEYEGVMHRVHAYYGLTSYLDFGAEQSFRQFDFGTFEYAVLMPQLTLKLNSLATDAMARVPVVVSTFVGSHVRINARRDSSIIVGMGLDKGVGRFAVTANAGFETTMSDWRRENGMRYQGGASWRLFEPATIGVESWGTLVWPEDGAFRQTHHAGPTFKVRIDRAWFALSAAYGMKEQPNKYFTDQTYLCQVGAAF